MDKDLKLRLTLAIVAIVASLISITCALIVLTNDQPQHESNYYTANGFSNLLNGDHTLRACDTWANTLPYTAWSHDKQSGNFAFAIDGTGANDGNCTNKSLDKDHDQHGTGTDEPDARGDIQRGDFSGHYE